MEDIDDDSDFGLYEAMCKACDAKLDRDFIRTREWDYSASAFGCPVDKRELSRAHVIAQHGEALEISAEEPPRKARPKSRNRKRKR